MAVVPSSIGFGRQFFGNNGLPLAGGLLYTFVAGTTQLQATYTDNTGAVAQANPIVLDSGGRLPNGGEVWLLNASYKFVLADTNGVVLKVWDVISPSVAGTVGVGAIKVGTGLALAADGTLSTISQVPAFNVPTQTILTSGSGLTYTTPAGVLYLRAQAIGGGGGGGAGGDNNAAIGANGGNTSLGSNFLIANGGGGGGGYSINSLAQAFTGGGVGIGGTATLSAGASGISVSGQYGLGSDENSSLTGADVGGAGAPSHFGSGGQVGASGATNNGGNGVAYGSGGGGGSYLRASHLRMQGHGGGAGGYVDALIASPAASYLYSVGAGGAGGTDTDVPVSATVTGGNGAGGLILITEYRQ